MERDLAVHNRDTADKEWHDAEARAKREAHKLEAEHTARVAAETLADAWQDRTAAAVVAKQQALRDAHTASAAFEETRRQLQAATTKLERLEAARPPPSPPPPDPQQQQPR